jgi:hypothetical protein
VRDLKVPPFEEIERNCNSACNGNRSKRLMVPQGQIE